MSIEKLEKIKGHFVFIVNNSDSNGLFNIGLFMQETINTLKEQSSAIADLQKELAKKEDVFDVSEVKEVRNLNKMSCGKCTHYDGKYCMLHPEYGEVVDRDTCKDYAEVLDNV